MLLDKACEGLNQALATGDRYRARLLLRLLAGLTTANVVSMPSMFATLNHIVSTAIQVLQGAVEAGTPHYAYASTPCRTLAVRTDVSMCTLCEACLIGKHSTDGTVHRGSPEPGRQYDTLCIQQ